MMSKTSSMLALVMLVICGSSILVSATAKRADRMKARGGGGNISCSIHTCVGVGDACSECNNDGTPCDDGCPYPTRCLTVADGPRCLVEAEGQECNTAGQECDEGIGEVDLECEASGDVNVCTPETPNNLVPGDSCDTSANCEGNLECTDGRCVGADIDDDCNDFEDCNPGLFCDTDGLINQDTCQEFTGTGGVCSEDKDCGAWFTCETGADFGEACDDPTHDCCFPRNGQSVGQPCGSDRMCESTLVCDNDECVEPDTTTVGNECVNNADCLNDGIQCECDFNTGNGICRADVNPCDGEAQAVEECLVNNGCSLESDFDQVGSCARNNCLQRFLAEKDCEANVNDETNSGSCQAIGQLRSAGAALSSFLFF